ncbi:MAG: hypothetical protein GEU96_11275 [Propionibacteriales bacterium]|nr:hypothetical protein [Propionibacteriales bacterium]
MTGRAGHQGPRVTRPRSQEERLDPVAYGYRLRMLGIDARTEQVYRMVLRHDGELLESVCDRVGRPLAEVRSEVGRLVALRLVRVDGDAVRAEPPDLALGRLVVEQQQRLQDEEHALGAVRASISEYVLDHASNREGDWEPVGVEAIEVADLISTMETLLHNSTGQMLFMRPDQWSLPTGARMDRIVVDALRDGRTSRVIYPDLIRDQVPQMVMARAHAGEQIRVLPAVPSGWPSSATSQPYSPSTSTAPRAAAWWSAIRRSCVRCGTCSSSSGGAGWHCPASARPW